MYYEIKEIWKVSGVSDDYLTIRQNLKEVRKYIKDWIDGWKNNAKENHFIWRGARTDNKTYAKCKIEAFGIDTFILKIKKRKGKKKNITGILIENG